MIQFLFVCVLLSPYYMIGVGACMCVSVILRFCLICQSRSQLKWLGLAVKEVTSHSEMFDWHVKWASQRDRCSMYVGWNEFVRNWDWDCFFLFFALCVDVTAENKDLLVLFRFFLIYSVFTKKLKFKVKHSKGKIRRKKQQNLKLQNEFVSAGACV